MNYDVETSDKEWFDQRVSAVLEHYNAYRALNENGIELEDPTTSTQIPCPFHDDSRPSARYYTGSKLSESHFYCFKCKLKLNGIALHARYRGIKFNEALKELERRFGIKIPKKPDSVEFQELRDKSSCHYVSDAWNDINRMIKIVENKLQRLRNTASMIDYVKFCQLLDKIEWDLKKSNNTKNQDIIDALSQTKNKMDNLLNQNDNNI